MTREEIQLLLKDLSARLMYGVMCQVDDGAAGLNDGKLVEIDISKELVRFEVDYYWDAYIDDVKPYLRPMSSMTEEEKRKFQSFFPGCFGDQWLDIEEGIIEIFECSSTMTLYFYDFERMIDWLNAHHFDYRGLIEKGLAIEAQEGMYNLNEK